MQSIRHRAVLQRAGDQIHDVGGRIDHRRAQDAEVADDVLDCREHEVGDRHRGRFEEAGNIDLPELHARIGVERVEGIAHRRDVHDVVYPLGSDGHVGHVQRLGEDVSSTGSLNTRPNVLGVTLTY